MHSEHFKHTASDGAPINVYCWRPDSAPKRVVHIVHGMAEHADRYAEFAESLTNAGYAVFAQDLRGHGAGAPLSGHFGDNDGWQGLVKDVAEIHTLAREQYPDCPVVLFGHSMGSFVAQDCAALLGENLEAVILSATDMPPTALRIGGQFAAAIEQWRLGPRRSSALLQALSFGNFNRPFDSKQVPAHTGFEWLSSDPAEVDKYIADSLCGFACTTQTWRQLLAAIARVQSRSHVQAIPAHLPFLLIAGGDDPVARNGKGPYALAASYRRAGLTDVSTRIYPGGRHELLNDEPREQVIRDMLAWLDRRLDAPTTDNLNGAPHAFYPRFSTTHQLWRTRCRRAAA